MLRLKLINLQPARQETAREGKTAAGVQSKGQAKRLEFCMVQLELTMLALPRPTPRAPAAVSHLLEVFAALAFSIARGLLLALASSSARCCSEVFSSSSTLSLAAASSMHLLLTRRTHFSQALAIFFCDFSSASTQRRKTKHRKDLDVNMKTLGVLFVLSSKSGQLVLQGLALSAHVCRVGLWVSVFAKRPFVQIPRRHRLSLWRAQSPESPLRFCDSSAGASLFLAASFCASPAHPTCRNIC